MHIHHALPLTCARQIEKPNIKRAIAVLFAYFIFLFVTLPSCLAVDDIQAITASAIRGDAANQALLGLMYELGEGVPKEYSKAREWFQKSADQGNSYAQYYLGLMYANGIGVATDREKAIEWLQQSAKQRNPFAQFMLGTMYTGGGISTDYTQGFRLLHEASGHGGPVGQVAQLFLGIMYERGEGTPKNYVQALRIYHRLTNSDIPSIRTSARVALGSMYELGEGVIKDYNKATNLYQEADEQRDTSGTFAGILHCLNSNGAPKGHTNIAEFYRHLADRGNSFAQVCLGLRYYTGNGVDTDTVQATGWIQKSADQGNAYGLYYLGVAYKEGKGVSQDYTKALGLLHQSVEQGNRLAMLDLSDMYAHGFGVPVDAAKADGLLKRSEGDTRDLDYLDYYAIQEIKKSLLNRKP